MAEEVLGYGADVIVEGPSDLVDTVVRRLEGVVGTGGAR
jgi:hypothetical protein